MNERRRVITQKIDRLDHPDATFQDAILEEFSRQPEEVRPVVLANLPVVNARVRRALLRWLDEVLDSEVSLPLMRYVFDERDAISERTGREMAMGLLQKRARTTDIPEERGRLRAFAEDMCDDDNPEVRRMAVRMLGFVGTRRSIPDVELRCSDEQKEVRQAAEKTLDILSEAPDDAGDGDGISADELRRRLVQSAGPRRRQLVRRWRRHKQRASIAVAILRRRAGLREEALRILIEEPTAEARPFLAPLILEDPERGLAALALRLLAKVGQPGQAGPDEVAAIRRTFRSSSVLNRAASCAAIKAFGLRGFVEDLVAATESRQLSVALEAARALDGLVDASDTDRIPALCEAVRTNDRRRRQHSDSRERVQMVAHLLSALSGVVSPSTIGVHRLQRTVFEVLENAGDQRPLQVTGIELLLASTPESGLDRFHRWDEGQASLLIELLNGADRPVIQRVAKLLYRGAPAGMTELGEAAYDLWKTGYVDGEKIVVPLLERTDTQEAREMLTEIANGGDERASLAARQSLRRDRNSRDVIDAEFTPRDDS